MLAGSCGGGEDDLPAGAEFAFQIGDEAGGGEDFSDADGVEPDDSSSGCKGTERDGHYAEALGKAFAIAIRCEHTEQPPRRGQEQHGHENGAVEDHHARAPWCCRGSQGVWGSAGLCEGSMGKG